MLVAYDLAELHIEFIFSHIYVCLFMLLLLLLFNIACSEARSEGGAAFVL